MSEETNITDIDEKAATESEEKYDNESSTNKSQHIDKQSENELVCNQVITKESDSNTDHVHDSGTEHEKMCKVTINDTKSQESSSESPIQPSEFDYELIDGIYYYTDSTTGIRYVYHSQNKEWIEYKEDSDLASCKSDITVDEEGRQYYWSDKVYLCKDSQGYTFYMDENKEWKPYEEPITTDNKDSTSNHWYYYAGNNTFYRDNSSNKVYKLNKDSNEWEEYKRRKRKKLQKDEIEEFDSDEEEDISSEEECASNDGAPPGCQTDPSITFDGKIYTKVDSADKTKYEWDPVQKAWFPLLDEDFMATYQLSYGFNPDGTKNENPLKFDDDEVEEPKPEEDKKKKSKEEKPKAGWFEIEDAHNTKVYVSNLPFETSEESFLEFMSKCGLVFKDPESQKFKVKLYYDSQGQFKGDALCTYIKVESVDLALQILDGYKLNNNIIKVERAKFTQKGDYNPSLKPKKKKKKVIDLLQKKQERLLDWHPDPLRGQRKKHENVVIFKNVFNPSEFVEAADRMFSHKAAIQKQAETFGTVKKVELFDRNPEGVVKVTFVDFDSADMCVATLDKRLYQKRPLNVKTWDGTTKYNIDETEEEKEERLKNWDKFIEGE